MSWIDRILPAGISRSDGNKRSTVPEGVWTKCIKCEAVLYKPDLERNASVCPKCDHHMRIGARKRLDIFLDAEGREEVFADIEPIDRLRFRDKKKYVARLAAAQKSTGERDALVAMRGTLHQQPVVVVAFEFGFHGGSMGQAVGEKFSRAAQLAIKERIPLVCFAASGGARMQEALISLMQMAKTSAVIERMHTESVPYISVLTDPIYGGVSASLALLGDLNIAEPDARAGFAGPNIIEQTIRQKLPKGFQRSEFLLEHGAIDMIVPRMELRDTIARILAKLMGEPLPEALRPTPEPAADAQAGAAAAAVAAAADDALAAEAVLENANQEPEEDAEADGEASRAAEAVSGANAGQRDDSEVSDAAEADDATATPAQAEASPAEAQTEADAAEEASTKAADADDAEAEQPLDSAEAESAASADGTQETDADASEDDAEAPEESSDKKPDA